MYLALCRQGLCSSGRRALREEGCYRPLCAVGSCFALEVSEANANEGEVEGHVDVHQLVEELHGQREQLEHSIIGAAYRRERRRCVNGWFGHWTVKGIIKVKQRFVSSLH